MKAFLKKNGVLITVLIILSIIAAVSGRFFQGQLLTAVPKGSQSQSVLVSTRACTSEGTMFFGLVRIDDVVSTFQKEASAVTAEREKFLRSSSDWTCPLLGDSTEPLMPALDTLSKKLPGWHYSYPVDSGEAITVAIHKPATFETFDSVMGELLFEYECKLSEMQGNEISVIFQNGDITDPTCGDKCPATKDIPELVRRADPFYRRITDERNRARYAIERTIQSLRSFEMQYPITRDLICFARASLDLRSEMSLLADATSCMPKIWDAATSLHDRAP